MWRVTIKGLLAHKLRLALTALAIVLGVTFIAGTFVLTDTLHNTFDTLFGNIYQNIDFQVRGVAQFGSGGTATRNPVHESLLAKVQAVPGVEAADGSVTGYAQYIAPDGKAISTGGAPTLGLSFDPNPQISELRLVQGTRPTTPDDVVMDLGTAQKYGFKVGQQVRILLQGPTQTFTITGLARFGTADNLAGATLAAFDTPTAQKLMGEVGQFDAINVVAQPGADKATVERAIARVLPHGAEVVTGQTVVNEETSAIGQALGFLNTALLVFAFIALFVGGFTILNTFSIIVGQRTRELALLRIVGASRRQVFRSVLGEAADRGPGVVADRPRPRGAGRHRAREAAERLRRHAAVGASRVRGAHRHRLPGGRCRRDGGLGHQPGPPRRADRPGGGRVRSAGRGRRPVAAPLHPGRRHHGGRGAPARPGADGAGHRAGRPRRGAHLRRGGHAGARRGPAHGERHRAPARPAARHLGPAGPGELHAQPAADGADVVGPDGRTGPRLGHRRVRRLAVSLGHRQRRQRHQRRPDRLDHEHRRDRARSAPTVPKAASSVPGVTATNTVYGDQFEVRGSLESILRSRDAEPVPDRHLEHDVGQQPGAVCRRPAHRHHHGQLGPPRRRRHRPGAVRARRGGPTMRIGGIYQPNALAGNYLVSDAFFLRHFQNPLPGAVLLKTDGSPGVQQRVTNALAAYPNVQVQSRAQFEASQTAQVNKLLGLVYALLALAVVIALIGIVNTLMLSVFERTHEIGLLRAVGMKRRQVRAMIRSESVILAVFGAVIGIIVGTGLGIALVSALHSQGITDTVVPCLEPGDLPRPGRAARPARRQLAGPPRRQARRAGRHRSGLTPLRGGMRDLIGDAVERLLDGFRAGQRRAAAKRRFGYSAGMTTTSGLPAARRLPPSGLHHRRRALHPRGGGAGSAGGAAVAPFRRTPTRRDRGGGDHRGRPHRGPPRRGGGRAASGLARLQGHLLPGPGPGLRTSTSRFAAPLRRPGGASVPPVQHGEPELVRFEKTAQVSGYENSWHHDVTWRERPSMGAILHAVSVPDSGGDTLFSDMYAAYDGLDQATKDEIDQLQAVHDFTQTFGHSMSDEERRKAQEQYPPVRHPVVCSHPATGKLHLYVNRPFVSHIEGLDRESSLDVARPPVPAGRRPRAPVPFHLDHGRRGLLGQPGRAALRLE